MAKKPNNDNTIISLKKEIEKKKDLLQKSLKFSPITNCSIQLDNVHYNLHVLTKDQLLYVIAKLRSLDIGLRSSGIEDTLIISGFPINDWQIDVINKYNILNIKVEETRLKNLENELHDLLSTGKKVELRLESIKHEI